MNKTHQCFSVILLALATLAFRGGPPCLAQGEVLQESTYRSGAVSDRCEEKEPGLITCQNFYRDGTVKSSGDYRDGKLEGVYHEFAENGQVVLEVTFSAGLKQGAYKKYSSDGKLLEKGQYVQDKAQGRFVHYYPSGQEKKKVSYRNGLANGLLEVFSPEGDIQERTEYQDGLPHGRSEVFSEKGKIQRRSHYVSGKPDGEWRSFDAQGRTETMGTMRDGEWDGVLVSFHPDGSVKTVIDYQDGTVSSLGQEYYPGGQPKQFDVYKDGALVDQKIFPATGQPEAQDDGSPLDLLLDQVKASKLLPGIALALSAIALFFLICGALFGRWLVPAKPDEIDLPPEKPEPKVLPEEKAFNLLREESQKMYRHMVENVHNGLFVADKDGNIEYANFAFAQTLGFDSKDKVIGTSLKDCFNLYWEEMKEKLRVEKVVKNFHMKAKTSRGKDLALIVSLNYIWDDHGKVTGIEGVVNDVTERNRLEEMILTEKRKLELILEFYEKIDTIHDMAKLREFIVEGVGNILEAGRCSLMLEDEETQVMKIVAARGVPEDIVKDFRIKIGEPVVGKVAEEEKPVLVKNIEYSKDLQRAKKPYYLSRSFIIVPFRINDKARACISVTEKMSNDKGQEDVFTEVDFKILRIISTRVETAIENVALLEDLNLQTVTDPLTKIFNYRLFSEELTQEINRSRREKTELCLAMIDIDFFKTYNDAFGHVEGDNLLRGLGEIMKEQLRDTDIICRYAGDEFCVVFPHTDLPGAKHAAEKLRQAVEVHPFQRPVTLSIGVAQYVEGLTQKDFIKKADAALYLAKEGGRNRVAGE